MVKTTKQIPFGETWQWNIFARPRRCHRMRLAKAMSLAHMRFGENPDPATAAEKARPALFWGRW